MKQPKLNYTKLTRRIEKAKGNKLKWQSYLDECYEYFIPEKKLHNTKGHDNSKLFDSTAQDSISDYANRMESQLVPSGKEWMKLTAGSEIPKDQKVQVDQQLENMTSILFSHINSSNFSGQINESFLDLGISTGAIIIDEGDGIQSNLHFRNVPLNEIIIERSEKGIVDNVFREITITYGDIPSLFPQIVQNLDADEAKKIEEKPGDDVIFIEGVVKNFSKAGSNYTTFVLSEKSKTILYEAVSDSSPWVVFRENTIPGESYGRGRAMRCLQDTKTLNKVVQYYIESTELLANPIYTVVDDGIINPHTLKVRPKTLIPVASPDTITPLASSGDVRLNIELIQRLQGSIRTTMLSKPFGQIDDTPVRTATEMSIRNSDLAETSSTAAGRIQVELLERVIKRCVFILEQAGKLPELRVDGKEVKIKYTSPSSQTEDKIKLGNALQFVQMMEAFPPEMVRKNVKLEEFPEFIAEMLDVSPSLIRTGEERKAEEEKMLEEQQQQLQMEANQQMDIQDNQAMNQLPEPTPEGL